MKSDRFTLPTVFYLILSALLILPTSVWSQGMKPDRAGQRPRMHQKAQQPNPQQRFERLVSVLDLTEDQQSKIQAIHLNGWEKVKPLHNDLEIKRAELHALMQSESPNSRQVNKKIDEISELETKLHKLRVNHQLEIRALLLPEQQMKFDQLQKHHKGKRRN